MIKFLKTLALFAAIAFIFGCDSGDNVTYNTTAENANSVSVNLSAASKSPEELLLETGAPVEIVLSAVNEYGDPIPGAQVAFFDGDDLLEINYADESAVTDAFGKFVFSVTADTNYFEEKTGEVVIRVTDGQIYGRTTLPYTIAPWSRQLWSDGLEISASSMRGIYGHTTEIPLPKGLEAESVSPADLGGSVSVNIIKDGSALSFTAYSSASERIETLDVKLKGVSRAYQIPVNIVVKNGSSDKPFPINSSHELNAISNYGALDSYSYILENDIDLTGAPWFSIDNFAGSLDGNNHSIIGLSAPFAKRIPNIGAEFKNIRFVIADDALPVGQFTAGTGSQFYGGIIAMEAMTLTLKNVVIEGGYTFTDTTGTNTKYLGLAAGMIRKLNADNITVKGYINADTAVAYAGLLAGSIGGDTNISSTVRNITAEGKINAKPISTTGAITNTMLGGLTGSAAHLNISGCAVRADITANYSANYSGGIAGGVLSGSVDRCYFAGNITSDNGTAGNRYLGGIAGYVSGADNIITSSYSSGTLKLLGTTSAISYAGGLIGYNSNRVDIINSYSSAAVNSAASAGGLIGNSASTAAYYAYIAYSAAVNEYIYGVTASTRIGNNLYTNSGANYAFGDMPVLPGPIDEGSIEDGISVSGFDAGRPEFFLDTLNFSLDVWDTNYSARSYKLPVLKGLGDEQKDFPNTNHYY